MSAILKPRRSALYMPGSNARALDKARTLPADALILDLEDAVAPDAKEIARRQVAEAVAARGFGHREIVVRINGLSTPWGRDDLKALAAAKPDAVLVPKVDSAEEARALSAALDEAGAAPEVALWIMFETPRAVLNAATIGGAGGRLACIVAGTNDLVKEFGAAINYSFDGTYNNRLVVDYSNITLGSGGRAPDRFPFESQPGFGRDLIENRINVQYQFFF
jgi:citrate lyase subunit beta/citryl-CoA lyase